MYTASDAGLRLRKILSSAEDAATDSEWDSKGNWLATSLATRKAGAVLIARRGCGLDGHPDVVLSDNPPEIVGPEIGAVRYFRSLLMFFSPKDLEFALGWTPVRHAYQNGELQQRRSLSGRVGNWLVVDLSGWSGRGSLKDLAEAVGSPHAKHKDALDDYKSCMEVAAREHPDTFVAYALSDAQVLLDVRDRFISLARSIQRILGIKDPRFAYNDKNIPTTLGRLVADTFGQWLDNAHEDLTKEIDHTLLKQSLIDPAKRIRSPKFEEACMLEEANPDAFPKGIYAFTGLEQCGVKYFAQITDDTACYNALVHGGRCNNERPSECTVRDGADVDLVGCYGSALRELSYPIGLPTVVAYTGNQPPVPLRTLLKRIGDDLVDGLWTITISNESHRYRQDLLYSRLCTPGQINRAVFGTQDPTTDVATPDDEASLKVGGDFVLLRKQLENAILTSDLLKAIKAVATNQELKEILDSDVVTACYYPRSEQCRDGQEWTERVIADRGVYQNPEGDRRRRSDTRTRAWFAVPLEGFSGVLADKRNHAKANGKKPLSNLLKLFVNTTYGVLASPYFEVSNTVVANNITARARLGVWMLNKALHTRQSITDGGIYDPKKVPLIKDWVRKLPGLDTLSDNTKWSHARKGRSYANLRETSSSLDDAAREHVATFWKRYGLTLPFDLEHKSTNIDAAYWAKADYLIHDRACGEISYRIRGEKAEADKPHPKYELLENILNGDDRFPDELSFTHHKLLRVKSWLMNGKEDEESPRPGDDCVTQHVARFNNTHCFIDTEADFRRRKRRGLRNEVLFERHKDEGIGVVLDQMNADKLRSKTYPPSP